jgi:putative tricarboxylic transport membrane protein
MDKNKSAPINLGALINKTDLIITIVLIIIISVLWFETKNFEKASDLFANNIPAEMFPQILLIVILGMVLVLPFEHLLLKKNKKDIDSNRKKSIPNTTLFTMLLITVIVAFSEILGAILTMIAICAALPIYWKEYRAKVLILYIIFFPLSVVFLFNFVLGVYFEPGLLEYILN